jgi:putative acetyltransferase
MSTAPAILSIRGETAGDRAPIHDLIMRAFGQPDEADLVDRLRGDGDAALSLVAEKDGRLAGHILFSPMTAPFRALALAPLSTAPEFQGAGVGSALIKEGLDRAKAAGWEGVFVLGDPAYYGRFGFTAEAAAGFASPYAGPYLMLKSLSERPLPDSGAIVHAAAFAALG